LVQGSARTLRFSDAARQRAGSFEFSRPFVLFVTVLVATITTVATLTWPPAPDDSLPWSDARRDVVREYAAVEGAWTGTPAEPTHFRLPGALLILSPVVLFPADHLTWTTAVISIAGVALLVAGAMRLAGRRGLLLAIVVPLTVAFAQAVLHGSLFVLVAAAICWAWVFSTEHSDIPAGILIGVAATARLWPALLLIPIALARRWRPVLWAGATFAGLNALGLFLPGASLETVKNAAAASGERWIATLHNGSIAAQLPFSPFVSSLMGLAVVMTIWISGLLLVKSFNGRFAWTLPAAILGSPLVWMPYLLALTPIGALYGNRTSTRILLYTLLAIQFVGFSYLPTWAVTMGSVILVWIVVAVERDDPFERLDTPPEVDRVAFAR
jgi:hypothetical protein